MGERRLGEPPIQESWDLALGRHQRALIELGYEGVTVEQVLEQRLRRAASGAAGHRRRRPRGRRGRHPLPATANGSPRNSAPAPSSCWPPNAPSTSAPEVLRRIRRLLAHYRATRPTLPAWFERFVTAGYAHYCTLLPTAFSDEDDRRPPGRRRCSASCSAWRAWRCRWAATGPSWSWPCGSRTRRTRPRSRCSGRRGPARPALRWRDLRARCDELLGNPLVVPAFPQYLSGFVQALEPVPGLAPFVVETLSKAFGRLPDPVLLPWLPTLITTLRSRGAELVPVLIREAGRIFPGRPRPWTHGSRRGEPSRSRPPCPRLRARRARRWPHATRTPRWRWRCCWPAHDVGWRIPRRPAAPPPRRPAAPETHRNTAPEQHRDVTWVRLFSGERPDGGTGRY